MKGKKMDDFISIGESAQNVLKKLTSDKIDKLCSRHIAKIADCLDEQSLNLVKKEMRFFADDVKTQVLGIYRERDYEK